MVSFYIGTPKNIRNIKIKLRKMKKIRKKSENIMNMKNKLKNTKDIKRGLKKNWTDSRIKDEKVSNPVLIEVITVAIAKL